MLHFKVETVTFSHSHNGEGSKMVAKATMRTCDYGIAIDPAGPRIKDGYVNRDVWLVTGLFGKMQNIIADPETIDREAQRLMEIASELRETIRNHERSERKVASVFSRSIEDLSDDE
jgi:hypothetical protein